MRLLIIEDESRIATALKRSLEEEHFVVDAVECGAQGSRLARINNYDLLILDHYLPNKDGLSVCKDVREYGKTTPILMLTSRCDVPGKVLHLDAGADDYLAKPFSLAELHARVRALLRRPQELRGDTYTFGKLTLDTRNAVVRLGNRTITLTRKEYLLLEYLVQHAGAVCSRGEIMEHAWDMNADIFSNTIETHILSLRRKLGDKRHTMIQTVSGRGYRFVG